MFFLCFRVQEDKTEKEPVEGTTELTKPLVALCKTTDQVRGTVCVVQYVTLCEEGDSLCCPVCDLEQGVGVGTVCVVQYVTLCKGVGGGFCGPIYDLA